MATTNDEKNPMVRISSADIRSITLLASLLIALLVSEASARPAPEVTAADSSNSSAVAAILRADP